MKPYQCGPRRQEWTDVGRPGFIITRPNGPSSRCTICEISDSEVWLDVGLMSVPIFSY
jgi:hypothetical protein